MTSVDFYILGAQTHDEQLKFACRLVKRAFSDKGHRVLVYADNEQQAKQLDDMLWVLQPEWFIPHTLLNAPDAPEQCPVSIGWQDTPAHHDDIIINLSRQIPPFFTRFRRYMGIVIQHDDVLQATRQHYKFLKDRGYPINNHDMRLR